MIELLLLYFWFAVLRKHYAGVGNHAGIVLLYFGAFVYALSPDGLDLFRAMYLLGYMVAFACGWPELLRLQRQRATVSA